MNRFCGEVKRILSFTHWCIKAQILDAIRGGERRRYIEYLLAMPTTLRAKRWRFYIGIRMTSW